MRYKWGSLNSFCASWHWGCIHICEKQRKVLVWWVMVYTLTKAPHWTLHTICIQSSLSLPGQLTCNDPENENNPKLWVALSGGRVVVFDASSWSMLHDCIQVGHSQLVRTERLQAMFKLAPCDKWTCSPVHYILCMYRITVYTKYS